MRQVQTVHISSYNNPLSFPQKHPILQYKICDSSVIEGFYCWVQALTALAYGQRKIVALLNRQKSNHHCTNNFLAKDDSLGLHQNLGKVATSPNYLCLLYVHVVLIMLETTVV